MITVIRNAVHLVWRAVGTLGKDRTKLNALITTTLVFLFQCNELSWKWMERTVRYYFSYLQFECIFDSIWLFSMFFSFELKPRPEIYRKEGIRVTSWIIWSIQWTLKLLSLFYVRNIGSLVGEFEKLVDSKDRGIERSRVHYDLLWEVLHF